MRDALKQQVLKILLKRQYINKYLIFHVRDQKLLCKLQKRSKWTGVAICRINKLSHNKLS